MKPACIAERVHVGAVAVTPEMLSFLRCRPANDPTAKTMKIINAAERMRTFRGLLACSWPQYSLRRQWELSDSSRCLEQVDRFEPVYPLAEHHQKFPANKAVTAVDTIGRCHCVA